MKISLVKSVVFTVVVAVIVSVATYFLSHQNPKLALEKITNQIDTTTHNQVTVLRHFKATANLEGFVVQSKGKMPQVGILYADRAGRYLVSGAVITADGKNLAEKDYAKYVQPHAAVKAFKTIANTAWIEQGKADAPHKLYAVIDPNCIFCHRFYQAIEPMIKSGQIAVRWIVIGLIKPSSAAKARAIFAANEPLAALAENEAKFKESIEEGGIKPLTTANMIADGKLARNMTFARANAIAQTPTLYFKTKAGVLSMDRGAQSGDALKKFVANLSSNF